MKAGKAERLPVVKEPVRATKFPCASIVAELPPSTPPSLYWISPGEPAGIGNDEFIHSEPFHTSTSPGRRLTREVF
jgi:hypothetical protein